MAQPAYVPLSESNYAYTPGQTAPYDYFHINSVKLDTDGNILISSRHTWTVYKVNRTTGAVIWRLGGKKSDYALGAGLPFAWQHDVEAVDSQTLRIFDNESDGVPVLPYSRVIWVNHNDTAMTASIVQSLVHPDNLSVYAEGNAQTLDNGNIFVDWGIIGRYSEFSSAGQLLLDSVMAQGYSSYRGYRFQWTGAQFRGVDRRFQLRGRAAGVSVINGVPGTIPRRSGRRWRRRGSAGFARFMWCSSRTGTRARGI